MTPFGKAIAELSLDSSELPIWTWLINSDNTVSVINNWDLTLRFGEMPQCQTSAIIMEIKERVKKELGL